MATFNFEGQLAAVIKIKDRTYTLVSDSAVGTGASKVKLKYHATSLDDAVSLGTMGDLVSATDTLADEIGKALNVAGQFKADIWTALTAKVKALPGFGLIFNDVINTEVRITDLELELDAPLTADAPISKGEVTLGIAFDCRNAPHNSLLGINLQAVGVLLSFRYGG